MWFDISIFIFLKFILGESKVLSQTDCNTITTNGVYYVTSGDNLPNTYMHLIVYSKDYGSGSKDVWQYGISYNTTKPIMYVRIRKRYEGWSDWAELYDIPSFYKNYNSLSALASAIGVAANISPANDDIKTDGLYFKTIYGDETGSYPSSKGIVFSIVSGGDIGVSLFIPKEGDTSYKLYIKYLWGNWGNSWTAII